MYHASIKHNLTHSPTHPTSNLNDISKDIDKKIDKALAYLSKNNWLVSSIWFIIIAIPALLLHSHANTSWLTNLTCFAYFLYTDGKWWQKLAGVLNIFCCMTILYPIAFNLCLLALSPASPLLSTIVSNLAFVFWTGSILLSTWCFNNKKITYLFTETDRNFKPKLFFNGAIIYFVCISLINLPWLIPIIKLSQPINWALFVVFTFLLTPIQCLMEEVIFRRLMRKHLNEIEYLKSKPIMRNVLNGLGFMLTHSFVMAGILTRYGGNYFSLILPCVNWFIFGYQASNLAEKTKGIEASWGMHTSHNILCYIMLGTFWKINSSYLLITLASFPISQWFTYKFISKQCDTGDIEFKTTQSAQDPLPAHKTRPKQSTQHPVPTHETPPIQSAQNPVPAHETPPTPPPSPCIIL